MHVDNKGKDILILSERPTQGLNATTLTAEAKYPISFTQFRKRFVLSVHYNESNSFFYCSKDWTIKEYSLWLDNASKNFTINDVKKKTELKLVVNSDIFNIHKYLMKTRWYIIIFGLIKKMFIVLLK